MEIGGILKSLGDREEFAFTKSFPIKQILVGVPLVLKPFGTTTSGWPVKLLSTRPLPVKEGATNKSTCSKSLAVS